MYCTSWRSHLKHVSSINELARSLCDVMENTGTFKGWAAFLGRIDARTRMLHYFLAGDVLALLHRARTGQVTMLPADMGAMGWVPFNCAGHREQLDPGDVLVVITDGLWEGMCSLGDDAGPGDWDHRLKDVVSQAVSKADRAEDIAGEIMASDYVRASLEAVPDDATIVVVRVDGL